MGISKVKHAGGIIHHDINLVWNKKEGIGYDIMLPHEGIFTEKIRG